MAIFHSTLSDALGAMKKGDKEKARKILSEHYDEEVKENDFLEGSIYALKLYLQNYVTHLKQSMEILDKKDISDKDKQELADHIAKCKENIKAFEDGTKELLTREDALN